MKGNPNIEYIEEESTLSPVNKKPDKYSNIKAKVITKHEEYFNTNKFQH